jgi:hypothetical protein
MRRLLFSPRRAAASFWAYTFTEDDVSLIIDEVSPPQLLPRLWVRFTHSLAGGALHSLPRGAPLSHA